MAPENAIKKIFGEIDKSFRPFLQFTSEMVQIPSVNPPGDYEKIAPFVAQKLQAFGLESQMISVPEEMVKERGFSLPRKNVIARLAGASKEKGGILLVHLDTVPVDNESLWTHPPFAGEIKDGRIWGRGSCDCKGRLASYALALVSIKNAGITLGGDVTLAAPADEEIGGLLGTGYLVSQGVLKGNFCILEGFVNEMLYGYGGALHIKISTTGKAAHTAFQWLGVNAIQRMQKVMEVIQTIQGELQQRSTRYPEMKHSTLNIGVIRGGSKPSIVPDDCTLEIEGRLVPEDSPDFVLDLIQKRIDQIRKEDPSFAWSLQVIRKNEAYQSDPKSKLVNTIQESLKSAGAPSTPIPVNMSRGGSDMKYFVPQGIPCVAFGAGRIESNLHGADENLTFDDFLLTAKTVAATLVKMLGIQS